MLTSLVLLATFGVVDFKGGDLTALAQAINKDSGQSVLISVFSPKHVGKCVFETKDADSMAGAVKEAAGFAMSPGSDPIFHPGTLPSYLVQLPGIGNARPSGFTIVRPPSEALKDGMVNWETKQNEAIRVGDLPGMGFDKSLDLHWMFQDLQLIVVSKGLTQLDFLSKCAKAVGAKLLTVKNGYRMELDPAQLRSRAQRTFDEVLTSERAKSMSAVDISSIELAKRAVASASNANIMQAFATQGAETRIPVGPGNVDVVYSRMQAMRQGQQDPTQSVIEDRGRGRGQRGTVNPAMFERLDPRSMPTWLVLRSNFQTSVEMMMPGPGGRGGRTIRF